MEASPNTDCVFQSGKGPAGPSLAPLPSRWLSLQAPVKVAHWAGGGCEGQGSCLSVKCVEAGAPGLGVPGMQQSLAAPRRWVPSKGKGPVFTPKTSQDQTSYTFCITHFRSTVRGRLPGVSPKQQGGARSHTLGGDEASGAGDCCPLHLESTPLTAWQGFTQEAPLL